MTAAQVQRALRIITSVEWKRSKPFPIAVLAQLAGLHRDTVFEARNGRGLTPRVVATLGPLLDDILAGRLEAYRTEWQVIRRDGDGRPGREERRFFGWLRRGFDASVPR